MTTIRLISFLFLGSMTVLVGAPKDIPQQGERDWVDARYAKVKFGPFVSGHIATAKGSTHKGIAIRVGDKGEGTIVFDTDLCTWRAGWTGGFLKTGPARYGLINPLYPHGKSLFANPATPGVADAKGSFADPRKVKHGPLPQAYARYKGLYVGGNRIVVRYDLGETEIFDSPWMNKGQDGTDPFNRTIIINQGLKNWKVYK